MHAVKPYLSLFPLTISDYIFPFSLLHLPRVPRLETDKRKKKKKPWNIDLFIHTNEHVIALDIS